MSKAKKGKPPRSVQLVAQALELSVREVEKLASRGILPRASRGVYPLTKCLAAYAAYWKRLALGKTGDPEAGSLDDARRRKVAAEAELVELELAERRGELVAVEDAAHQYAARLERIRARVLVIPGKYAAQILGIKTIAEAQLRLVDMTSDVMTELATLPDDPIELEGESEDADTDEAAERPDRVRG